MLWTISFFLGNGRIFGLTEDEDKFRRWQIYKPEVARAVSQFEDSTVNEHSEFQRMNILNFIIMKILSPCKKNLGSVCLHLHNNLTSLETLLNQMN